MLLLQSILFGIQVGKSLRDDGGNNLMNRWRSNCFVDKGLIVEDVSRATRDPNNDCTGWVLKYECQIII